MKYLKQMGIILLVTFVGEILHWLIPLAIPAGVYGIVLLFILLETGILPLEKIQETGKFLVEIMPVMFIPAAVGLLDIWGTVKQSVVSYIVIILVTTVLVMGVSGLVTQFVIRKGGGKRD